jgi:hypothetical protein
VPQDIDIDVTDDKDEVKISIKAASPKLEFSAWLTAEDARQVGAVLMKMADRIEGHSLATLGKARYATDGDSHAAVSCRDLRAWWVC